MIDLHTHVLPGLGDGAATVEETLEILRAMACDGATVVAATPHVRDDYPTTPRQIEETLQTVRQATAAEHIRVDVLPGPRSRSTGSPRLPRRAPPAGLAGNPGYLLVEFPYHG